MGSLIVVRRLQPLHGFGAPLPSHAKANPRRPGGNMQMRQTAGGSNVQPTAGWSTDALMRSRATRALGKEHGGRRSLGLGWVSIGLGGAQIVAPNALAQLVGAQRHRRSRATMRGVGLREITCGLGILSRSRPAVWLWARVLGDAMDLALLGSVLTSKRTRRDRARAGLLSVA